MALKLAQLQVKHSKIATHVFGLFKNEAWPKALQAIDKAHGGTLGLQKTSEKFDCSSGKRLIFMAWDGKKSERIVLLGLGSKAEMEMDALKAYAGLAVSLAREWNLKELALHAPCSQLSPARTLQHLATGALLGDYRFDRYLADSPKREALTCHLVCDDLDNKTVKLILKRAEIIATAVCRARDLVNEPASVVNPGYLAKHASTLAKKYRLKVRILNEKEIAKEKMGLFLAVGIGSTLNPPRFIHLSYIPKKSSGRRIFLIGKGITFDSGGLSLKPAASMEDMKIDMSGAATVLSTLEAVAQLAPQREIHVLVAAAENMPDGQSYRPGDVIRSRNGKTVEVLNTDAEGRLTLADAITWAKDHKAEEIVELSTLTGACMVALGPNTAGLFTRDEGLASSLLEASGREGEKLWRMPLEQALMAQLKSPIADLKNIGTRYGGAITAGLFLQSFAGDTPFAHLDIAGPATAEEDRGHIKKGGRGFCVSTLIEMLCPLQEKKD